MTNEQDDWEGTLIEPQGVNAGGPIDERPDPPAGGAEEDRPVPPDTSVPSGATSEEMVGLPEQIPGYPGQQRSIDTS